MRIALFQPEIAGNVGAVMRLGACFGVAVDLIEPMGFAWDDKRVRRTAMDYIDHVEVDAARRFRGVSRDDRRRAPDPADHQGRAVASTISPSRADDILLFGKESAGVPAEVAAACDAAAQNPDPRRSPLVQPRHLRRARARRSAAPDRRTARMTPLDDQQQAARDWFESLRTRICAAFEAIEREAGSDAAFELHPVGPHRRPTASPGGGGVRGQMNGKVFEKVGVNVSTVGGRFSPEFAASIPGAEDDPSFFATGISLVAHMANPHVPAVHMNCRFLTTTRRWFGGGADLNPAIPYAGRHRRLPRPAARRLRRARPDLLPALLQMGRGIFLAAAPQSSRAASAGSSSTGWRIISTSISPSPATSARRFSTSSRRSCASAWTSRSPTPTREALLEFRGRYVEFNLLYDRGTLFGLKTGGNIDAILMSLPPLARWA